MHRVVGLSLTTLTLLAGCAEQKMPMDPFQKPEPPAELAKLNRLMGTWSGTAEMVSPTAEEMNKKMPADKQMPSGFHGEQTAEWTLDGMWLKEEGWHEIPGGEKSHYLEYWTWDPKVRKYRTYFMSDMGESREGLAWFGSDPNTMHVTYKSRDVTGATKTGKGYMKFVGDDTITREWTDNGPMGKMKMRGTFKRSG